MKQIPVGCREFKAGNSEERRSFANEFLEEFVRGVAPPKYMKDPARVWTAQIRDRLIEMCPEDCEVIHNEDKDWREYLLDFAWKEKGPGGRYLLACESEWAPDRWGNLTRWGRVQRYLRLLLSITAPFKLLLFSSIPESLKTDPDPNAGFSIEHALDRIKISLQDYPHTPGETYMLLDFPATGVAGGDEVYDAYIWIAEEGREEQVRIDPLASGKLNPPTHD
jgi:hypothetical protein